MDWDQNVEEGDSRGEGKASVWNSVNICSSRDHTWPTFFLSISGCSCLPGPGPLSKIFNI